MPEPRRPARRLAIAATATATGFLALASSSLASAVRRLRAEVKQGR